MHGGQGRLRAYKTSVLYVGFVPKPGPSRKVLYRSGNAGGIRCLGGGVWRRFLGWIWCAPGGSVEGADFQLSVGGSSIARRAWLNGPTGQRAHSGVLHRTPAVSHLWRGLRAVQRRAAVRRYDAGDLALYPRQVPVTSEPAPRSAKSPCRGAARRCAAACGLDSAQAACNQRQQSPHSRR